MLTEIRDRISTFSATTPLGQLKVELLAKQEEFSRLGPDRAEGQPREPDQTSFIDYLLKEDPRTAIIAGWMRISEELYKFQRPGSHPMTPLRIADDLLKEGKVRVPRFCQQLFDICPACLASSSGYRTRKSQLTYPPLEQPAGPSKCGSAEKLAQAEPTIPPEASGAQIWEPITRSDAPIPVLNLVVVNKMVPFVRS